MKRSATRHAGGPIRTAALGSTPRAVLTAHFPSRAVGERVQNEPGMVGEGLKGWAQRTGAPSGFAFWRRSRSAASALPHAGRLPGDRRRNALRRGGARLPVRPREGLSPNRTGLRAPRSCRRATAAGGATPGRRRPSRNAAAAFGAGHRPLISPKPPSGLEPWSQPLPDATR